MRWWDGLADVDAAGPEGAPGHRLAWRAGELHLVAHPDPEAEQALGALGGDRCPCLDVFEAWHAVHDDGAILTVAPRDDADVVDVPLGVIRQVRGELRRWQAAAGSLVDEARLGRRPAAIDRLVAVAGPPERAAARRLGFLLLVGLDARLLRRLTGSVAMAFAVRPDRRAQLAVATAARVRPLLEALGWEGGLADIGLGLPATVEPARAVVPEQWLATVWARGIAGAVPGMLVLDVTEVTADGAFEVVAAAPGKAQVASRVARVGE